MDLGELKEHLESITGDSPIDNARRLLIMELITRLQSGGDTE